jgi:hypothetical protein
MLLMRIERFLLAGRSALVVCAFSLAAMAVGCGDETNNAPPTSAANAQEQQEKERAAREAAYGKGGNTKASPGDAKSGSAGRTSSKPN